MRPVTLIHFTDPAASRTNSIDWPRSWPSSPTTISRLMDACGTELPLMWMLHQRGYDVESLHKRQSEIERECDAQKARADAAEKKLATLVEFFGKAQKVA